jgi:hypothetical protein
MDVVQEPVACGEQAAAGPRSVFGAMRALQRPE